MPPTFFHFKFSKHHFFLYCTGRKRKFGAVTYVELGQFYVYFLPPGLSTKGTKYEMVSLPFKIHIVGPETRFSLDQ